MSSLVAVGRVGRPHGIAGEAYLDQCPLELAELRQLGRFTWRRGAEERTLTLVGVRPTVPRMLVRFEGVASREQASELTNGELMVPRDTLPDPGPGVAYAFQVVGLEVRTVDGRVLGRIADVLMAAGHPLYVVHGDGGKELMIPVIEPVVRRVDLGAGVVTVDLPPGLEEL